MTNISIMMIISSNFILNFIIFCVIVSFLTKLLTLDILFTREVRAVVAAKLVLLGVLILTSIILVLRKWLVAKLVTLGILPLISFILPLKKH